MSIFKHIKSILLLKQVATAYKEETGKDKPQYLSRRFVGVVITTASVLVFTYTGLQLDIDVENTTKTIETLGLAITTLYGIIMSIVGQVKKAKIGAPK